jgi:hypothetical protein
MQNFIKINSHKKKMHQELVVESHLSKRQCNKPTRPSQTQPPL